MIRGNLGKGFWVLKIMDKLGPIVSKILLPFPKMYWEWEYIRSVESLQELKKIILRNDFSYEVNKVLYAMCATKDPAFGNVAPPEAFNKKKLNKSVKAVNKLIKVLEKTFPTPTELDLKDFESNFGNAQSDEFLEMPLESLLFHFYSYLECYEDRFSWAKTKYLIMQWEKILPQLQERLK